MIKNEAKIKINTINAFCKVFELSGKELVHIDAILAIRDASIKLIEENTKNL